MINIFVVDGKGICMFNVLHEILSRIVRVGVS